MALGTLSVTLCVYVLTVLMCNVFMLHCAVRWVSKVRNGMVHENENNFFADQRNVDREGFVRTVADIEAGMLSTNNNHRVSRSLTAFTII